MDHLSVVTLLVIAGALLFSLSNGWNDAANAIATAVCTRVLTPVAAIVLGAALNFAGALVSDKVALTQLQEWNPAWVVPDPDAPIGISPAGWVHHSAAAVGALIVLVAGWLVQRRRHRREVGVPGRGPAE